MLHRLSIRNYAIISELDIHFGEGLNIITGETGAGKSILVGALGLVLGDRSDSSVLADPSKKAIVEAVFTLQEKGDSIALLRKWDIEDDEDMILRREVSATGKSRAFINDTPVTLAQLQQFASSLVDLHMQFDTGDIGQAGFQLEVLDALCKHKSTQDDYGKAYTEYTGLKKKLDQLEAEQAAALQQQDFKIFLLDELTQLGWKAGEMEQLQETLNILSHAEQVKSTIDAVGYSLEEGESPVLRQLKAAAQQLQSLSSRHPKLPEVAERLQSVYVEVQDIASDLSHLSEKIQMDPKRLDELNERMSAVQKLIKKHGASDAEALVQIQENLRADVDGFQQRGEEIDAVRKSVVSSLGKSEKFAVMLHENRKKQMKPLEEKVMLLLQRIGMPNARLKVELVQGQLRETGMDQVVFMFDANKSDHFEPLHKVASGGERSRLMLSVKSLVAGSLAMPTLIFDEIDSGISGEAAKQVGILMKELGRRHQLISITHQPQIAARADRHFFVSKKEKGKRIQTEVDLLDQDGHVEAIAKMMGGERPSQLVLENAREMVMNP